MHQRGRHEPDGRREGHYRVHAPLPRVRADLSRSEGAQLRTAGRRVFQHLTLRWRDREAEGSQCRSSVTTGSRPNIRMAMCAPSRVILPSMVGRSSFAIDIEPLAQPKFAGNEADTKENQPHGIRSQYVELGPNLQDPQRL